MKLWNVHVLRGACFIYLGQVPARTVEVAEIKATSRFTKSAPKSRGKLDVQIKPGDQFKVTASIQG